MYFSKCVAHVFITFSTTVTKPLDSLKHLNFHLFVVSSKTTKSSFKKPLTIHVAVVVLNNIFIVTLLTFVTVTYYHFRGLKKFFCDGKKELRSNLICDIYINI